MRPLGDRRKAAARAYGVEAALKRLKPGTQWCPECLELCAGIDNPPLVKENR